MRGPTEVLPRVHRLGSPLVNWYLVEDEGRLTAVDAGLPGFRHHLEADLNALGHRPSDVEAVVLTHPHSDHTGVAPALRDAGARILIHSADEPMLHRPAPLGPGPRRLIRHIRHGPLWRFMGHNMRHGGARPPKIEGAETFEGGEILDLPGRPRVVATPGHTPGHCVLDFERHQALFVGDALCTWDPLTGQSGPRVMPRPFNGDTKGCLESLAAVERLWAKAVLPAHGEPWHDTPAAAVAHAREAWRG